MTLSHRKPQKLLMPSGTHLRGYSEDIGSLGWILDLFVLVLVLPHRLVHVIANVTEDILHMLGSPGERNGWSASRKMSDLHRGT